MNKIDIQPFVTNQNALEYANTTEKTIFCHDLVGTFRVGHPAVDALDDELYQLAIDLGYILETV